MSDRDRTDPRSAEEPSRDLAEGGPASTTHLPHKPTRDAATAAFHLDALGADHPGPDTDAPAWAAEERQEVGGAADNRLHPPHATENDREAAGAGEAAKPHLPANAGGSDRVPADAAQRPVDEESMYENRRSQDKDRPPSADAR